MKKILGNWKLGNDLGILIFRLVLGFSMFYGHGIKKWAKLFGDEPLRFADPIGIGEQTSFFLVLLAEGVCVFFILFGFLTRLAAIPLIVAMFVAAFVSHAGTPFGEYELAFIYFVGFIGLFFTGGGKYSVDYKLFK